MTLHWSPDPYQKVSQGLGIVTLRNVNSSRSSVSLHPETENDGHGRPMPVSGTVHLTTPLGPHLLGSHMSTPKHKWVAWEVGQRTSRHLLRIEDAKRLVCQGAGFNTSAETYSGLCMAGRLSFR